MKNASSYYLFALKKLFFSRRFVLVFRHFHAYSLKVSFMVLLLQDCANRIKHAQHNGHNYFFSWEYELTKDLKVIDDHYDFVDDDEDGHIHSDCTAHKVDWITGRNICRRHCMDLVSIETRWVITTVTVITIIIVIIGKGWLASAKLRSLVEIILAQPIRGQDFNFSFNVIFLSTTDVNYVGHEVNSRPALQDVDQHV